MTDSNEALGAILRAARELAGIKLTSLARAAKFSTSYITNIEKGRKEIHPWIIEAYQRVLGVDNLLAASTEGDDMQRRTVLGALSTLATLGVHDKNLVSEALRIGLLSSFDGDDWTDIAAEHGTRFMTETPMRSRAALTSHLILLRSEMSRSDRLSVKTAATRLTTLHAMATANLGDTVNAIRWYRTARIAADRTGDADLQQWVRGREAFRRGYEGASPDEVLALSRDLDVTEGHLAKAKALARLGHASEARQALEQAHRTYEHADQAEHSTYAFQPWRYALSVAHIWALLGDARQAEQELASVQTEALTVRFRTQHGLTRALAVAGWGDIDEAQKMARDVMASHPRDHTSMIFTTMLEEISGDHKRASGRAAQSG